MKTGELLLYMLGSAKVTVIIGQHWQQSKAGWHVPFRFIRSDLKGIYAIK